MPIESPWAVHKFGGTCLADADRFRHAARLAAGESAPVAVVVSAPAGVTDGLIRALDLARSRDERCIEELEAIRERMAGIGAELDADLGEILHADVADVVDVLRGVMVARTYGDTTLDLVSGFGELWSARAFAAELGRAGPRVDWLDAREVLVVDVGPTGPLVDWEQSQRRMDEWSAGHGGERIVITGFIASDPHGIPTTLRRNGSDYSASIFAKLLGASAITIWTDVDGVMSADPRCVPEAELLSELSYDEAMELAYFGAEVLHPHTMGPAVAAGIPIRIKNIAHPGAPGTTLSSVPKQDGASAVKGFSSTDGIALLNVEGAGMIGVPGIASRLFDALREVSVSVIMVSQASSEHSICVAIREADARAATAAVRRAFASELDQGAIRTVAASGPYSILAAVGDRMVETPGVAARLFGGLADARINVHAIAQGSSERNISTVVAEADRVRALRAVHAGFYLSDQTLSIGLIGPGSVGAELLRQIGAQADELHSRFHIDLRLRGVATSSRMVLAERGIPPGRWTDAMNAAEAVDLRRFGEHVGGGPIPHSVIIDCTASDEVPGHYSEWLAAGIHVVTPNKKDGAGPLADFRRLQAAVAQRRARFLAEATVGAGLPVISTLRDLLQSGDRVARIEGVLSGTLSFLFNTVGAGGSFSTLVAEARANGFTEPDPREDLAGTDVARKAVILAREIGHELELGDVATETLVPDDLRASMRPDEFVAALARFDRSFERRRREAEAAGEVLRYVAVIDGDGARVGVRSYSADHAFARLVGGDNIIAFTTDRYREQPLIVQGPGAGPAVTAGGVFADLLRIAAALGAT